MRDSVQTLPRELSATRPLQWLPMEEYWHLHAQARIEPIRLSKSNCVMTKRIEESYTLHDAHRYDINGRLYRFVQIRGYESSYLPHEGMIVNIPCFHGKNDRYAPGIGPRHFHDGPYGNFIAIQQIDE
jgi:hypothetical protein